MDAVAAGFESQIGAVIEDESDAAPLRLGPQFIDCAADRIIALILEAQLHAGDVAAIQGFGEQPGEGLQIVDAGRGYQIQTAGGRNDGTSAG
jgi:hypothetical protein